MIRTLRQRHLAVWAVLAVLLPALLAAGLILTPRPAVDATSLRPVPPALPVVLAEAEGGGTGFVLRADTRRERLQLECHVPPSSGNPPRLLYRGRRDEARLVGVLSTQGVYRFEIGPAGKEVTFVLYDPVHGAVDATVQLLPAP